MPEKELTPPPASVGLIYISSSDRDSENAEMSEESEKELLHAKRRRLEGRTKNRTKLPPGFLDPLPLRKTIYGENKELEHKWDYVKRRYLLEQYRSYYRPPWRKNKSLATHAWERIALDFNKKFPDADVSKGQLQETLYNMKKIYKVLKKLSELSGFEWDYTSSVVKGPEDKWKALLLENKDAKKWYKKPWPYYTVFEELNEGNYVDKPILGESSQTFNAKPDPEKFDDSLMNSPSARASPRSPIAHKKLLESPSQTSANASPTSKTSDLMEMLTAMEKDGEQCMVCPEMRTPTHEETEFSIKRCIAAFYRLDGFSRENIWKVGKVFKVKENREIFLSLRGEDRKRWLKGELAAV
ncbi:hypothetical protein HPP92_024684 [Vanilla planifolia]|uniref:Myb/SANT-like domain-containing protein n=1 Tax=Vanilla planifolia TaxID=51239 RepID=A0A835UBD8_VANPL|nr:hypothetical protein HPP92_024684 [Vanilla planifolia]